MKPKVTFSIPLALALLLVLVIAGGCQQTPEPTPTVPPAATATPTITSTPTTRPTATLLPTATPTPISAVVTDTLRVREEPNTESNILGRLRQGDKVLLLARREDNRWYQIEYPPDSGERGWIAADYVVPSSDPLALPIAERLPQLAANQAIGVAKDFLRVRKGPGTEYDTIGYLKPGREITINGTSPDGKWYRIPIPPDFPPDIRELRIGWVLAEFIDLKPSSGGLEVAVAPPTPTPTTTPRPGTQPTVRPTPASASGGRILLASNAAGSFDIYSVGANGAGLTRLTSLTQSYGARFSPDGRRIAFYRFVATAPIASSHIFVMNANGSGLVDLSRGDASETEPDWSPDGTRLLFIRTPRAGGPEIWVMNSDGSNRSLLLQLTADSLASSAETTDLTPGPRWSPDGRRIAFAAVFRPAGSTAALFPSIYAVNADGKQPTQLTDNDRLNTAPVWSPDGSQIAFASKDFINRQNWKLWVMNADGSGQRALLGSIDGDPNQGVQPAEWVGKTLLVAGWRGTWDAYLLPAGGGPLQPVTGGAADSRPTDWLP